MIIEYASIFVNKKLFTGKQQLLKVKIIESQGVSESAYPEVNVCDHC